jgi:hypothetical protein
VGAGRGEVFVFVEWGTRKDIPIPLRRERRRAPRVMTATCMVTTVSWKKAWCFMRQTVYIYIYIYIRTYMVSCLAGEYQALAVQFKRLACTVYTLCSECL